MISVRVTIDAEGCLSSLDVTGHAAAIGTGENAVCAAVTAIVRAVGDAIVVHDVRASGRSTGPGSLSLAIDEPTRDGWLRGVSDVLVGGIERIAREHPGEVTIDVQRRVDAAMEERGT